MTVDELEKRVKQGEKLVILDDLILNVSKFMNNHPGGTFFIE